MRGKLEGEVGDYSRPYAPGYRDVGFFFFFFGLEGKRKEGLGEGRAMWKNAPSEDSSSFIWPQISVIHCKPPPSAWVQFCQPG